LLPDHIELYALNLPGRGSRRHEPLATAMTDLVPLVVEALPDYLDKPFIFFGHSVGALVAFAVADHLHQAQWPLPLHLFVSAHAAPHRAGTGEPMYQLADADLAALVRQLGLVPDEVLVNTALLDLILPPLKADFELSETFRWGGQRPLPIPITVLGGHADTLVTEADLSAWADCTAASFDMHMFEGGHFYTQDRQREVMALIAQAVDADVGRLEKSILYGETAPYPQLCLHEWFRQQAARTPDAPALVSDDVTLRFRELDALTDVLARYLQHRGVGVDRLVGIYMETSVTYVMAYLAVLKAGGAYMPIELAYPEALLSRVLDAAQPVVILTLDTFQQRLPTAWQPRAFSLEAGWEQRLASETLNGPTPRSEPTLDALAYCVMSSGTTGTPKGILCPHRGAVNSYAWRYAYYPYEPGEREACNVFFVWEVMRPLLQGLPSYIIPDEVIYDPPRLVEFLSRHRITRVLFTPSLLEQMLNTPNLDISGQLRHLRVVYLNGEVVTTALCNRFHQRLPQVTLLNDYSISECHDVCTYDLAQRHAALSPRYAPLGPPMTNVRLYLLDEHLQPVSEGFRGEIYVGGDSLARGYLNDPERTAERFVRDPIRNDGSMLFRTGDAGRILPNGHLEIQGRMAFMVKLRGYSIVPGAVEAAMAQHPAVQGAVVTTLDNEQTGQPEHLVAYVVGNGRVDDDTLVEQLRPHLKARLPHYAVPTFIVPLAELPIAAMGKLDRRQLPKPDARLLHASHPAGAEQPQNDLETAMAAVWQEVLQIDGVEATANFFDLGGHSLLAATLSARLRQALGCDISVVDIFQAPTIRLLARSLQPQAVAERTQAARPTPSGQVINSAIAVIGLACRFPGADTAEQFWHNLSQGVCSIRALSPQALQARGVPPEVYEQPDYIKVGATLEGVEYFDPGFWGLSRREAVLMDPQHRLFVEACWHALEHAGYAPTQGGASTGVFAGSFLPLYLLHYLHGGGLMRPDNPALAHLTEIGNDKDYLATRVSHLLNLRGPSLSVQASCSTGLVAVATACQALLARQCDMALAGASSLTLPQAGYTYQEGFVYSRDGQCRAFDADASGTVLGDGVGVVVLKRLDDARAAGDNILALIKGFAVNNDGGLKADYSAPSVQGQAAVVAAAQAMAGVEADTISYIEAHGTGTLIGDPIEVRGLTTAFRQSTDRTGFCALGSVKPNIGHSNIAAGMAGLIKVILSMQHRQLPPTIHFTRPNPAMRLDETPFYVNDRRRAWETPDGIPRRAGVTSLGIGGTNSHVILEEWVSDADPGGARSPGHSDMALHQLLTLSAKTPNALEQNRRHLITYLETHAAVNLGDVAYTLSVGRNAFAYRHAVTCHDISSALAALATLAPLRHTGASHDTFNQGVGAATRRSVVLMFTGQGAPYLHMGRGLYDDVPTFRRYFDACCERLIPLIQADLRTLLYHDGDDTEVRRRAYYLQPSLFAVSYALAQTLIDWGIRPTAVVGHSLGEYAAACVAGMMSLEDALSLVVTRGYAMEEADEGAMLAVNLGEAAMLTFLAEAGAPWAADGPHVSLAAVNGPHRTVLSGRSQALADVAVALQDRGVACRRVDVARAFHSPMMQQAAEAIVRQARLITLHAPAIPLVSNLTGTWLTATQAVDAAYWGEHMLQTVRFGDNIQTILQQGPDVVLEIGPGRLLTNLVAEALRHLSDHAPVLVPTMRHARASKGTDRGALLQAVGRLWTAGIDVDWHACHRGEPHRRVALPGYAFERHRCWPDEPPPGPRLDPTRAEAPWTQDRVLPLAERFYLPSWKRALPARNKLLDAPVSWLVWLDHSGPAAALGEALVAALMQQGHPVQRVYRAAALEPSPPLGEGAYAMRADAPQAYATLLDQLAAADLYPQRMVYLWSLNGGEASIEQALTHTYEPLLYLAQALATRAASEPLRLWVVTDQTMQVSQEALQPMKATILGPSLVLPQEAPHVSCRVLDLQLPAADDLLDGLVGRVLQECLAAAPDGEAMIALRGEQRWLPAYEPVPLAAANASAAPAAWLQPRQTYLITGGLGRIGMVLAQHLAGLPSNLVLTTRTAFPARAQWESLADAADTPPALRHMLKQFLHWEILGTRVLVLQADLANASDVERILTTSADRFSGLSGIFHAAGHAHLRYLTQLTPDDSAREFAPKIQGLLHLEKAIGQLPCKPAFVVLFSSMASILGGLAMTAYVAANRFMDAFVQAHPRRHGVSWLSINWDDWDFAYAKEQVLAYEHTPARFAMTAAEGVEALRHILAYGQPLQLLVATRPLPLRLSQWVQQRADVAAAAGRQHGARNDPATGEPVETGRRDGAATGLVQRVAAVYQEVLGLEAVDAAANFFDLGGDSLLAAQILLQLRRQLRAHHLQLPAVFEYPTVREMARYIMTGDVDAGDRDRSSETR
jgi:amino acid adenylation domain-containing protein